MKKEEQRRASAILDTIKDRFRQSGMTETQSILAASMFALKMGPMFLVIVSDEEVFKKAKQQFETMVVVPAQKVDLQ